MFANTICSKYLSCTFEYHFKTSSGAVVAINCISAHALPIVCTNDSKWKLIADDRESSRPMTKIRLHKYSIGSRSLKWMIVFHLYRLIDSKYFADKSDETHTHTHIASRGAESCLKLLTYIAMTSGQIRTKFDLYVSSLGFWACATTSCSESMRSDLNRRKSNRGKRYKEPSAAFIGTTSEWIWMTVNDWVFSFSTTPLRLVGFTNICLPMSHGRRW